MKKLTILIVVLITFLSWMFVASDAQTVPSELVVWKTDGSQTKYALRYWPKIVATATKTTITTRNGGSTTMNTSDVHKYTLGGSATKTSYDIAVIVLGSGSVVCNGKEVTSGVMGSLSVNSGETLSMTFKPSSGYVLSGLSYTKGIGQDGASYNEYSKVQNNVYTTTIDGQRTYIVTFAEGVPTSESVQAIDLGLSVKWANKNLGALNSISAGSLYLWDADKPSSIWGDNWRLPSHSEQRELATKCTWTTTTVNGKTVFKVTGPNGNFIYLPKTGMAPCMNGYTGDTYMTDYGCYYSKDTYTEDSYTMAYVLTYDGTTLQYNVSYNSEIIKMGMRPVYNNPSYTLSVQSGSGGTITYNGTSFTNTTKSFSVSSGSSVTLNFTPNSGYYLSKLTVDGVDKTSYVSNNSYTISNITANTSVVATFAKRTYTLSIQAIGPGHVTYNGSTFGNATNTSSTNAYSVVYGNSATLYFSPNSGYYLSKLTVDGVDKTSSVSNNSYTISSITANTTVVVTFTANPITNYTLSIQTGSGGTVSYNGTSVSNATKSFSVSSGSSATLNFTPNSGYYLSKLTVDGVDKTSYVSNNSYTISNITSNTTVVATFAKQTYTLSIEASGYGTVEYSGPPFSNGTHTFYVSSGSPATLTFSPNSGYYLSKLTVDGVDKTSYVSNNKYTISSITSNTTVVATFAQTVTEYSLNDITYSLNNQTLNASVKQCSTGEYVIIPSSTIIFNGNYYSVTNINTNAFCGNTTMKYVSVPSNITTVGDGIFEGCTSLAAVEWYPTIKLTSGIFGSYTNPNLLVYVKDPSYAPQDISNVVVNGTAESITLTDAQSGNNFYCPQAFTAKSISYTHNFKMKTGNGTTQGWETLSLPFDVQDITHESKGAILPFANLTDISSQRPFWLYERTTSGWQNAKTISANTPYIISMPNNSKYDEAYILKGNVTFSATDVVVPTTTLKSVTCGSRRFTSNFQELKSGGSIYALNVANGYGDYSGGQTEGSVFVNNSSRTIHPFEAYMVSTSNAKPYIPIFDSYPSGMESIPASGGGLLRIYNLSGLLVLQSDNMTLDEAKTRLPAGVYIVNGNKMIIK